MRHFLLIFLSLFLLQNVKGQDSCSFKYLFIGHAYGSQDKTINQQKTIRESVEKIRNINFEKILFLGDVARDTLQSSIDNFNALVREIGRGALYLRGNHDAKRDVYEKGPMIKRATKCWDEWITNYFPFTFDTVTIPIKKSKYNFVVIDTENPKENIDSLIKAEVKYSTSEFTVFLSHRLIWAYSNPRYKHLVELTNSPRMHQLPQVVDMDFLNAQKDKKFYFFAGDLGVNIPLFYDKVGNVAMYAVGCGGTIKDAALLAEFKRDTILTGLVHLGTANYSIEDYSLEKINQMPLPGETITTQQGFKGYQLPIVLGIFALLALALYMVIKPNE